MNVLIVDDDRFTVSALQKKIDWAALRIDQVYTAYNIRQAKRVFEEHPIDILISDIEMPQGSGLELLAWVREDHAPVQTIFLTNYADFNYAQKAIELHSFDYYLKPIEFDRLTLIIEKAVRKAEEEWQKSRAVCESRLWQQNKKTILEHFWMKTVSGKTFPSGEAITRSIQNNNLPYQPGDRFLLVLVNVFPVEQYADSKSKAVFGYGFLNVLQELFGQELFSIEAILEYPQDYNWTLVLGTGEVDTRRAEAVCDKLIENANEYLACSVCCNIGIPCGIEDIHRMFARTVSMNEDMINCWDRIFSLADYHQQDVAYIPPNLEELEETLARNDSGDFLARTLEYLRTLATSGQLNAAVIRLFRLDMVQIVYSFLSQKEIQAHKLFAGESNDSLHVKALHSIENMQQYLGWLVNTAIEYRKFTDEHQTVAEQVRQYIQQHYGEDLSRNRLAETFYLNPDYLTRLFKKETETSLVNYITQTRLDVARELLLHSTLPVSAIADKVGYGNYSHFSKVFKENCKCSPNEYRKLHAI